MKFFSSFITMLVCLMAQLPAAAQTNGNDDTSYRLALNVYHCLLSPEAGLYKGTEYINYNYPIEDGTPFFNDAPFDTGSVVYHSILYEKVLLAYDVVRDEVVIYDASRLYKISLISSQVSGFRVSGLTFIRLGKDSTNSSRIHTGFYQSLYEGKTRVLKKETRNIQERFSITGVLTRYIVGSTDYFIETKGMYYPISNKSSLLSVLHDKEKELQQFIRKKRFKFRTDKDNAFAQITAYYDTITK